MKKKKIKAPIVVIGASSLGVELISELRRNKNDILVVDKQFSKNSSQAVLRNQHTLQSGVLQLLNKNLEKSTSNVRKDYLNIAENYRDLIDKYSRTNLISDEPSCIEITTNNIYENDNEVKKSECAIVRYIENLNSLGFKEFSKKIDINTKQSLGDFSTQEEYNQLYFELPDKSIDYDRILQKRKGELALQNKTKGDVLFLNKSKTVHVNAKNNHIITDKYEIEANYIFIAAGIGTKKVLKEFIVDYDRSESSAFILMKTKNSICRNLKFSTFAKYIEVKDGNDVNYKFLFAAKHGAESLKSSEEFLVVGNANNILKKKSSPIKKKSIPSNYNSFEIKFDSEIKDGEQTLLNDYASAFAEANTICKNDKDKFNTCVLKHGEVKYHPYINKVPNSFISLGHPGLASTSSKIAQKLIKNLEKEIKATRKLKRFKLSNVKIDQNERNKVIEETEKEAEKIIKLGSLIDNSDSISKEHSAWFRTSKHIEITKN